jgi:hypothetical protein
LVEHDLFGKPASIFLSCSRVRRETPQVLGRSGAGPAAWRCAADHRGHFRIGAPRRRDPSPAGPVPILLQARPASAAPSRGPAIVLPNSIHKRPTGRTCCALSTAIRSRREYASGPVSAARNRCARASRPLRQRVSQSGSRTPRSAAPPVCRRGDPLHGMLSMATVEIMEHLYYLLFVMKLFTAGHDLEPVKWLTCFLCPLVAAPCRPTGRCSPRL